MRDEAFIEHATPTDLPGGEEPDRLLVDGACLVRDAKATEPEFHRLMLSPVGV
jgi:hypothetical protein